MGPVADGKGEEAEENLSSFKLETLGYVFDSFAKQPCIGRAPVGVSSRVSRDVYIGLSCGTGIMGKE
jgi:hypothetical protein